MSSEDSVGVTLAMVDPSLLSSWEAMVKRGEECSLMLKHSKGKITATLQCTTPTPSPGRSSAPSPTSPAKKRKKRKGSKEKRLKALLAYHQRLVVERGLPPSRLMEAQAETSAIASASPAQSSGEKEFKCDHCDFSTGSQRGLKVHIGRSHKMPEIQRDGEELELSLNLSQPSEMREDEPSSVNADLSLLEANLVLPHFCGLRASPNSNICEQSVFACGDCFHLWRTKEELQNCSCSTLHNCSPYCLYVDVLSKDCTVT